MILMDYITHDIIILVKIHLSVIVNLLTSQEKNVYPIEKAMLTTLSQSYLKLLTKRWDQRSYNKSRIKRY